MLSRHTQRSTRSGIRYSPTNPNLSITDDPEATSGFEQALDQPLIPLWGRLFGRLTVSLTMQVDHVVPLWCDLVRLVSVDTGGRVGGKE